MHAYAGICIHTCARTHAHIHSHSIIGAYRHTYERAHAHIHGWVVCNSAALTYLSVYHRLRRTVRAVFALSTWFMSVLVFFPFCTLTFFFPFNISRVTVQKGKNTNIDINLSPSYGRPTSFESDGNNCQSYLHESSICLILK